MSDPAREHDEAVSAVRAGLEALPLAVVGVGRTRGSRGLDPSSSGWARATRLTAESVVVPVTVGFADATVETRESGSTLTSRSLGEVLYEAMLSRDSPLGLGDWSGYLSHTPGGTYELASAPLEVGLRVLADPFVRATLDDPDTRWFAAASVEEVERLLDLLEALPRRVRLALLAALTPGTVSGWGRLTVDEPGTAPRSAVLAATGVVAALVDGAPLGWALRGARG